MVVVEVQSASADKGVEELSAGEDLVRKLEDFFMSPEIMVAIGDFMHESVQKLYFVGAQSQENNASTNTMEEEEETHPIENYEIFSSYGAMIEEMLEKFLQEQKADADALYQACLEEKLQKGNSWDVCLDYLLASLDYEFFLTVAHDFYQMQVDDN